MPPEYIPPRKGFPEQWRFDRRPPFGDRPLTDAGLAYDLGLAVGTGGVIVSDLVRFLVFFEPGANFPIRFAQSEGDNPEVDPYRTAWVRLDTLRTDLLVPRPRPLARLAEKYLGWPVGSIDRVISVSLANG